MRLSSALRRIPMTERHAPILAVIDPTAPVQPALARAAALAERTGAPLLLLACIFDPYIAGEQIYPGIDLRKLRRAALDHQLAQLRDLAQPLRERGLKVLCRAVFDHPLHEGIVREALRSKAAFVLKDTHPHSGLNRVLFTNTDWHLMRECPAPLWLVKPHTAVGTGTVLAAVDPLHQNDKPADLDRRIIDVAQELSVLFERRLHVAHVYDVVLPGPAAMAPLGAGTPITLPQDIEALVQQEHGAALERLTTEVGFPADQVHLRRGEPGAAIPALARELDAAVVVMGAVSRSRLRRVIVGNTAERVLEALPCDVVIVKPRQFLSPVTIRGRAAGYMVRESAKA